MYSRWRHPPKTVSLRPYCRSRRGRNGLGSEANNCMTSSACELQSTYNVVFLWQCLLGTPTPPPLPQLNVITILHTSTHLPHHTWTHHRATAGSEQHCHKHGEDEDKYHLHDTCNEYTTLETCAINMIVTTEIKPLKIYTLIIVYGVRWYNKILLPDN